VFDVDGDGADEVLVVTHRATREERFLALVARTPEGAVAHRLADTVAIEPRLSAFRTGKHGCALLVEDRGGNRVQGELYVLFGAAATEVRVIYKKRFVQDPGDVEDAPSPDGALWLSVIDVIAGGEPELVLTFIDPLGEPGETLVLDINGGRVKELGAARPERAEAAGRLGSRRGQLTRSVTEALVRLEPESVSARLSLLDATDALTSSQWWGFFPPGSNNFIALHGAYYARHAAARARPALSSSPRVAAFLARWGLTPDELGSQSEPLIPPSALWGRARFVETSDVSTVLGYFRLE
jgi:hypothetical protein